MQDEGGRDGAADPDPPSQTETQAAIEAALTADTYDKILAFARKRCAQLRHHGFRHDSDYPEQPVANVIADTYTGQLTWRPTACALDTHLCQTIKGRTNAEHRHRAKFPLFRPATYEWWDENLDPVSSIESIVILRQVAASAIEKIEYEFFKRRDEDVLAILAARRVGATKRADVSMEARISVGVVDNARVRIGRFLSDR